MFVSLQQMLLKLVKRLASLQHQQQPSNTNQIIDELVNNNSGTSDQANDNNATTNAISSSREFITRLGTTHTGVDSNNNHHSNNNNSGGGISNNSSKKRFFTNNIINNTNYQRVYQDGSDKIDSIATSLSSSYSNKNSNSTNEVNVTPNKQPTNNMGSNVSRHSGKGLSGRRTQSSGLFRKYKYIYNIRLSSVQHFCHAKFHFPCEHLTSYEHSAYLHIIKMESTFRANPILIIPSRFP